MKTILIADDHVTVRAGLRAILEARAGWEVVAEASDGNNAVAAAVKQQPDLAIIDYSMPHLNGLQAAKQIIELRPATKILLFTIDHSDWLAREALRVGALAVLLKSNANKMLVGAVKSLIAGKPFRGLNFSSDPEYPVNGKGEATQILSPRERTVVKLVAEGYSNKSISAILSISIKTTETHRAAAMRKLDVNSVAGLVRYAFRSKYFDV